jgi:hypothetical protein
VELIPDLDSILDSLPPLAAELVGMHKPQGKASAWRAIAGFLGDTANALEPRFERLSGTRSQTSAALVGQTAQAADKNFTALLDAGSKLVDELHSGSGIANSLSLEIESAELGIFIIAVTAARALYIAYASLEVDPWAALAEILTIRFWAELEIGKVWSLALERVTAVLAEMATKTVLMNLLKAGLVGAEIGAGQELAIEGIEVLEGHRSGIDVEAVLHSALSMGVAGLAGGAVGYVVGGMLGNDGSLGLRLVNGAVTGLASGEAANIAGTLAGGGHIGADTLVGGMLGVAEGGLHGAGGEHGAAGSQASAAGDPTESPAAANAIDTHPTLRFEKQPDGTFAWPGDSANDGASQPHSTSPPTTAADPGAATGDRASSPSSNGSPAAGDSGARPAEPATAGRAPAPAEAAGQEPRSNEVTPTTAGAPASPTEHLTAEAGPAHPETTTPPNATPLREGTLVDLSATPPPASASPATVPDPVNPTSAEPSMQSSPAGASSLAQVPPNSAPTTPSVTARVASIDHSPSFESSSPPTDARAGLADSGLSGKSTSDPPAAAAARCLETAAAHADAGMQDTTAEQAASGQPASVDPPAQAGRSGTDSHVVGREDSVAADRQRRSADLVTKRQDPARPDTNRHDSRTGPRGRPDKLRRSGVARDAPEDLQPAATRAPDPLAATNETGIIKAHHDDASASDHPGTAGSEVGDYRGGDGGHGVGDDGGAGDGAAGHGESGGKPPGPDRPVGGAGDDPEFLRRLEEYRALGFPPPIFEGWEVLRSLHDRYGGAVVFHGSNSAIPELEPRQTFWTSSDGTPLPDGDPAVCADAEPDVPAYMALFKGKARIHYRTRLDGRIWYMVEASRDQVRDVVGYVHVLPREDFEEVSLPIPEGFSGPEVVFRSPELRAFHFVRPLAIVRITLEDFPHDIDYSVDR